MRLGLICMVSALLSGFAIQPRLNAQTSDGPGKTPATMSASTPEKVTAVKTAKAVEANPADDKDRLVPWVDYRGDLWHRAALTGDWGGLRQKMMDQGLRINVNLTQTYQGNWKGGTNKDDRYQGNLRYEIDMDTGKLGLWPGGMFHVRGETKYGHPNNRYSGGIMPVNTDALYPTASFNDTCLSEAYYVQFLAPWIGFAVGKMSPRDNNIFSNDETSQFMNSAFNFNPVIGTTVPFDFLTVGAFFIPTDWFTLTTLVLDTDGKSNVSGFDTAFKRGTSVYQSAEFAIKPFDQNGHQRLSWAWTDKAYPNLRAGEELRFRDIIIDRLTGNSVITRQGSDWCIMYDFDQYLYTKPGTKDQGVGLFGRFGLSDGSVNPVQYFYSLGMGGKGMIPGRDNDTFGVGYYYLAVSNKMGPVLSSLANDEQGIELYYNIAITPWLHITPDIQIIDPGRSHYSDTAVVAGVRMKIDF